MFAKLKPWLGRKSVRGIIVVAVLLLATFFIFGNKDKEIDSEPVADITTVSVTTAEEVAGGQTLSLIGSVRAFTEAKITSETGGRVVSVPVTLGQEVSAGQVIASLENASQRASVLQAEGSYDAAVAAAAQTTIGVDEAKNAQNNSQNNAVSAFKSAYNSNNIIIRNSIDQFFANPDSKLPGVKISSGGLTQTLNNERVAFQTLLLDWQSRNNTISSQGSLISELQYAEEITQRTINFVDLFLTIFTQQKNSDRYSSSEIDAFQASFTSLRSSLIGTQGNLKGAQTSLIAAADTVKKAQLSSSGGANSAADAQVKQALGSLRAAQANLAKTILRSPISGTINSLDIRTGDYIGAFKTVAEIANNNALQVVTYLSENESNSVSIGETVMIEDEFMGVITEIAPAVDSTTGKIEVRIATEDSNISNGDTVHITKEVEKVELSKVIIPLSSVRFEIEDGYVLVVEDGVLIRKDIVLGLIRGGSVEIISGLSAEETFVIDARGLQAGIEVNISK